MAFINDDESDLGSLWHEALEDYAREAGIDLRAAPQVQWQMSTIMTQQSQQLSAFSSFRHNKGKVDKLRSTFAKNADIVQSIASHVANAASAAFPPAAALLTAFTYVMAAAKGVSDDYDMIESFFDIMNGFLERLSLLEARLPPESVYQTMLIRCFSAILHLSAIARNYRKSGRFSKWAKALVDQQDPKLKGAYDLLQKHLSRLESMTLMATFKQTLVITKEVNALGGAVQVVGSRVDHNIVLTEKGIALTAEGIAVGMQARTLAEQAALHAQLGKEMGAETLAFLKAQQEENRAEWRKINKSLKSGPSPPATAGDRRGLDGHDAGQFADFQTSYIKATFDWVDEDDALKAIMEESTRLMWIAGANGMGKTTLSMSVKERLAQVFLDDSSVSICHFCIREDYTQLRDVSAIVRACAQQVAQRDSRYRDHALGDIRRHGKLPPSDTEQTLERLFLARFGRDAGRRAILVLDGLDELDDAHFDEAKKILSSVAGSDAHVQVVFSSGTDFLTAEEEVSLGIRKLELTKDKIHKDMWKVAIARTKTLSRLRKLRLEVRRKVATRIRLKADNMRYIDHMTRRLNALGPREGLILKELDHLPDNTEQLYDLLIEECQRHRTPEELVALRIFFGWLAFSRENVSLGAANKLLHVIASESGISVDEELDGKSARLLRLANSTAYEDQASESSDLDFDDQDEDRDGDQTEAQEDLTVLLGFQERSLRAYFKKSDAGKNGLRSSASEAHKMIFETVARAFLVLDHDSATPAEQDILQYGARYWRYHLAQVDIIALDNQDARHAIEHLHSVLDNKNNALKKIQEGIGGPYNTTPSVFGDDQSEADETLGVVQQWARRAINIPGAGQFSAIQEWFRPLVQNPARIYIGNARHHICYWFQTSNYVDPAYCAFRHAYEALRRAYHKGLPELQQNEKLRKHFEQVGEDEEGYITEEAVLLVSNAFWDVPKSSRAHWTIAMALKKLRHFEAALRENERALDMVNTDLEAWGYCDSMGRTLMQLAEKAGLDTEAGRTYLRDACEALERAVTIQTAMTITEADDVEVRDDAANIYVAYALAEFNRGDIPKMQNLITLAKSVPKATIWYDEILAALEAAREYGLLLETLRCIGRGDRSWYLGYYARPNTHTELQKAAVERGEAQMLIDLYAESVRLLDQGGGDFGIGVRIKWAKLHWQFLDEPVKAKALYSEGLALTNAAGNGSVTTLHVGDCVWGIVDILIEEFRRAASPAAKTHALDELKTILLQLKETLGDEYDEDLSQATVPLALMTRKLGPATEFEKILKATFNSCIADLSDTTGLNDSPSLRTLAKVLSCIDGLEHEAQIAASCQLYVLEMGIYLKETQGAEEAAQDQVHLREEVGASASAAVVPEAVSVEGQASAESSPQQTDGSLGSGASSITSPPSLEESVEAMAPVDACEQAAVEAHSGKDVADADGDLSNARGAPYCDRCFKEVDRWTVSSLYLCLYCVDRDLCGDCYSEKMRREREGAAGLEARVCHEGHRHVKAPVEGWGGVKDGVIRIDGKEVAFDAWLKELQEVKWPKAWSDFWAKEPF
ncbi:hypothetical protein Micbo1qcDRAFT_153102 [Microdochium bolleyi]|uniref:NACHT domain-containing protein n=1 Tax=Microdochium bolleyi TaxID=196109 RepID=A0A136IN31_9PEZI|nr:hypothetical protein Micbo1qcDRAFT_153102 [Microdochium bolleyi]